MSKIDRLNFKFYPVIHSDPACAAAMKSTAEARDALKEEERKLEAAIRATMFFKSIEALAHQSNDITVNIAEGRIQLWEGRHAQWGVEFSDKTRPTHIDPKTLNALIQGKLLSPEEKRALLKSQGIDVEVTKPT